MNKRLGMALKAGLGIGLAVLIGGVAMEKLTGNPADAPVPAAQAQGESAVPTGQKAPTIGKVKLLNGKTVSLEQYKGKVVIVDFWATWCGPCRMAIPVLQDIHKKYGSKGVVVVGASNEDAGTVAPFAKKNGMTYTLAADPEGVSKAMETYKVQGIPTLLVVDKKGVLRLYEVGFDPRPATSTKTKLNALVAKLVAEKA
jgi:thiol-disulfide isomerase/thioredoxin